MGARRTPDAEPDELLRRCGLMVMAKRTDQGASLPNRRREMFETYVPEELKLADGMFELESFFEQHTEQINPPACLRCYDLKPRQSGGAYRAARTVKEPDFHGFTFGDTIEQAIESLEKFFLAHPGGTFDIKAWARPMLLVRDGGDTRVLFVDRDGLLISFP